MTNKNVLVVCDRGIMDPSAYMPADGWQRLLNDLGLKQFDLLNKRYDQVYHICLISLRVIFREIQNRGTLSDLDILKIFIAIFEKYTLFKIAFK